MRSARPYLALRDVHHSRAAPPSAGKVTTIPLAVYQKLKRLGMDLVTVTDHDSIDAAEPLRRFPDFFLSEEVTCRMPSGTELHVGVYDITERQHVEIQRRRNDLESLAAYLDEQRLFFSANHVFSSLTGRRAVADFECFERIFPGASRPATG